MKLFQILGFLLIALSVPVLTVLVTAFIASQTIPLSREQISQITQIRQELKDTSLVTDKSKQERVLHLLRQIPFKEVLRLLSIVSIVVFLAILSLSRFFKSRFLRNSLLIGALTTLIFSIIYGPITTLLLMLAILYTTYKLYEPHNCPLY